MNLANAEFYSTPDGEVMIKECDKPVRLLVERDRNIIQELFMIISDRYPEAFNQLSRVSSSTFQKSYLNRSRHY